MPLLSVDYDVAKRAANTLVIVGGVRRSGGSPTDISKPVHAVANRAARSQSHLL
jgi:hypothetical protein